MKLVKLHPYNKRMGWVMRTYTMFHDGKPIRFMSDRGWYQVDDVLAAKLEGVPQQSRMPAGPRAFIVVNNAAEAKARDEQLTARLRSARDEVVQVGTAETPVAIARPGARDDATQPRTRRRRSSAM
jgi:hypothetical protein